MIEQALKDIFTYHPPVGDQKERYEQLRAKGLELAEMIQSHSPPSPEQTIAIRKVQEAIMYANAAIAINE